MANREDPHHGRRRFIGLIGLAAGGLAALVASIPLIGFFVRPARSTGVVWRDIGALAEFEPGITRKVVYPTPDPDPWDGLSVRNAAWVRREADGSLVAFSIYCTHTGCPVTWVEDGGLFLCPCHGGVFDRDGGVSSGPPPRPLDRTRVRVRGGRVEIEAVDVPTPS